MRFTMALLLCFALAACGPGEMGPPGPAGPPGAKGDPGPSQVLKSFYSCAGFIDLTGTGSGANIDYEFYTFADGSVLTTCAVAGGLNESTGVFMYKSSQAGSVSGYCSTTLDMDASSGGWWSITFVPTTHVASVTYHDSPSQYNGRTYTVGCTPY